MKQTSYADATASQLEWTEQLAKQYPTDGLQVVEDRSDWHVGSNFNKPPPVRQPKPSWWQRVKAWYNQPSSDMKMEAEVFRGLNNPFI